MLITIVNIIVIYFVNQAYVKLQRTSPYSNSTWYLFTFLLQYYKTKIIYLINSASFFEALVL